MTSSVRSSSRVALTLLASLPLACTGPNPLLEAGGVESETTGDGDGDTETTGDGDTETDGDGDGDGDTTGDGDGDADGCSNGMLDGDETDLDCGGSCTPCGDGLACLEGSDCASMICSDNLCAAPSCDDGIKNGTEFEVDCGGDCTFCEYGPLQTEFDVFEGSSASLPQVEMLASRGFALTYVGDPGAKLAWFDEFGDEQSPAVEISADIEINASLPVHFAVDIEANNEDIHVVEPGLGPMGMLRDLFLVRRTPAEVLELEIINTPDTTPSVGDIAISGNTAYLTWTNAGEPLLRRYDYSIGDGSWIDITPLSADGQGGALGNVAIARNSEGISALAWLRCNPGCQVVARRFDGIWLENEPVLVYDADGSFLYYPQIAFADDGSAFVAWFIPGLMNDSILQARMLDQDFQPMGEAWTLQMDLATSDPYGVATLSDGSFAISWADRAQGRVHLSRYVGPNTFKNPNYPDEGPWDNLDTPREASIATIDNRLVVVWTATVDMVDQVQGQVLAF